jgi:hypothetical protein
MSISETCGVCGSSFEVDRSDELQLWKDWILRHLCKPPASSEFFSSASPMIEQSESKLGFVRDTQYDDE